MRPGPSQLFPYLRNKGNDTLGIGWTKDGHIAAWQKHAKNMSAYPHFACRTWAFDFTNLPMSTCRECPPVLPLYLETAEQASVFDVLAAAHPRGPSAVIAKTESLHVDLEQIDPAHGQCSFRPNITARGSFATA